MSTTPISLEELLPCRACGAPCSVQSFSNPEKGIEATLWMCSKHRSLGGDCPNETAYLYASAWNERPTNATGLEELKALLEKATALPWRYMDGEIHHPYLFNGSETWDLICTAFSVGQSDPEDGPLIVAAINALPSLLSTQERMRAALEEVVNAVRDYLPPDGIDAQACLNRVIGAVDNPEINPVIREIDNGRS